MSYVVAGNKFFDSEEILKKIQEQFTFKGVRDITKGSKRDDTLIYQIIQDAAQLKEELLQEQLEPMEGEEWAEEIMALGDEKVSMIEAVIPEEFLCYSYSYYYDEALEELKCIFVALDKNVGELRLMDVAERILRSID